MLKIVLQFSALTSFYTSIVELHSDTVVWYGAVQVQMRLVLCKTGLLEL